MSGRRVYAFAALIVFGLEVVVALFVHDRIVRPFGGDALAVVLVYCGVRAVTGWRWPVALAIALGIAVAVELGQLVGLVSLLRLEGSRVARVVLGTSFAPLDFVAYALGGATVAAIEGIRGTRHV